MLSNAERSRRYRERHPDRVKAAKRRSYERTYDPVKRKATIAKNWPRSHFGLLRRNTELNAKAKGVPFEITTQYLHELYAQQNEVCALSGLPFQRSDHARGPSMRSLGLDRIVASVGYVPGNVRFLLHGLNCLKADGTDADVKAIILAVVHQQKWLAE